MKLCDRFGNELSQGDAVAWTMPGGQILFATVEKCINPGAVVGKAGQDLPGKIVISIEMGIAPMKPDEEGMLRLDAFIKSWNPESQKILKATMA